MTPLCLEPRVGLGDGHHVDLKLGGELSHAGQKVARGETSAGNQGGDLIHDLSVDRQTGRGMDGESECGVVHMCIIIVIHTDASSLVSCQVPSRWGDA